MKPVKDALAQQDPNLSSRSSATPADRGQDMTERKSKKGEIGRQLRQARDRGGNEAAAAKSGQITRRNTLPAQKYSNREIPVTSDRSQNMASDPCSQKMQGVKSMTIKLAKNCTPPP